LPNRSSGLTSQNESTALGSRFATGDIRRWWDERNCSSVSATVSLLRDGILACISLFGVGVVKLLQSRAARGLR
jgi:hypothetical protein